MHIVSSIGDPESPATWSGTPANITASLKALDAVGSVRSVAIPRGLARMGQILNIAGMLGGRQPERIGLNRRMLQRKATAVCAALDGPVLHFGSAHLPLLNRQAGSSHYLFLDYTATLLVRNARFKAITNARYRARIVAIERDMVHGLEGIYATSDYVRHSLINDHQLPAERVSVTGTGVGTRDWTPLARDYASGHLVFVAKFNFVNKGGPLLLDAFDLVRRTHPHARLTIIGNTSDPEQRPYHERMLRTPGIDFRNYDTPNYLALLKSASLYAGPALDEPWGIIYLEVQLAQTPVLMLNRNAAAQFTDGGRTGYLVDEATSEAVARVLARALDAPAELKRKGREAREFVQDHFSWARSAALILEHVARHQKELRGETASFRSRRDADPR